MNILNKITCRLFGHRTVKSCDGLRWMCVRCEETWLIKSDTAFLDEAVKKWLNDEAFIRTDIP